ncbi:DUF1405 domain-containing protein, partial [Xanthomonas citri pv. citri]|nr:DUF1405 domain-containing protein [Xanthomonas citri pv. citri]
MKWFQYVLGQRPMLILVLAINFLGTV